MLKLPALKTPVRVEWLDSVDSPGWQYAVSAKDIDFGLRPAMITRGVLVAVDEMSIAVATTIAPKGETDAKEGYLDVLTIPKGCILSVRVIP